MCFCDCEEVTTMSEREKKAAETIFRDLKSIPEDKKLYVAGYVQGCLDSLQKSGKQQPNE